MIPNRVCSCLRLVKERNFIAITVTAPRTDTQVEDDPDNIELVFKTFQAIRLLRGP
jgi:hypothetical protein